MKRFLLFIVAAVFAAASTNAQGLKFEGLSTTTSTADADNVILNRPLGGGSYGNRVITFANFRLGLANSFTVLTASTSLTLAADSPLLFTGRSVLTSPSNGLFLMTNAAGSDFTTLCFGGSTFTFPGLGKVGGDLEVKSADSSEGRAIRAARLVFNATATPVGNGMLWHNGTHAYYRDNAGVDHQIDN